MVRLVIQILIVVGMVLATAQAGVYKWVDEDGQIHFGDQPKKAAERVKVHKPPVIDAATQERIDRLNRFDDEDEGGDDTDRETQEQAEKLRAQYKEFCDKTRERLRLLEQGGRLYEVTKEGERDYLTDEGRLERIKDAERDLKKHCQ